MDLPDIKGMEDNLRVCLLLKADDLYFTMAEPHGAALRNDFLGIAVTGLADENLSDSEIASIDLNRFAIAERIRALHAMLADRKLSLDQTHLPDVTYARQDALDFVEHFISTLPNVALGGIDRTQSKNEEVHQLFTLAYAWLNLVETIEGAFNGETMSALSVTDLALLSGLDTRTLRNHCGPGKHIRTSATRSVQDRGGAAPAFVSLHALDTVDWLQNRKSFTISKIDPEWISKRVAESDPAKTTRGLLIAGIVNLGALPALTQSLGITPKQARDWFDDGTPLPEATATALLRHLLSTTY